MKLLNNESVINIKDTTDTIQKQKEPAKITENEVADKQDVSIIESKPLSTERSQASKNSTRSKSKMKMEMAKP